MAPAHAAAHLRPTDGELGLAGERIAARHLRRRGLRVRARRLRTAHGEIDLALLDAGELVVCEVKSARRVGRFRPGDRLDPAGLARRARVARRLAIAAGIPRWRVDLVEVVVPPARGPLGLALFPARVVWVRGIAGGRSRTPTGRRRGEAGGSHAGPSAMERLAGHSSEPPDGR
jgi:putative endonuclease